MKKSVLILVLLGVAGCSNEDTDGRGGQDAGPTPVERGRYLVNNVAQCSFCHTPLLPDGSRDTAKLFGGNPCMVDVVPEDPSVGCLPSRNLTPSETGLKFRTDAQIKAAIRDGIRTDGQNLAPVMPYWLFHNMSDGDLDAMVAYLRTLTPVDNLIPARQPPWDSIPATIPPIDPESIPRPRADYPEKTRAEHGRYLAGMAGLCIDCHTPDLPMTDPNAFLIIDRARFFQGNRAFPSFALGLPSPPYPQMIFTANLTPDMETGTGRYSVADIVSLFRNGKDKEGQFLCAPTHGGPTSPYAAVTDSDLEDIAHYILSMSPVKAQEAGTCDGIQ